MSEATRPLSTSSMIICKVSGFDPVILQDRGSILIAAQQKRICSCCKIVKIDTNQDMKHSETNHQLSYER